MKWVFLFFGTILMTTLLVMYSLFSPNYADATKPRVDGVELDLSNTGGTYVGYYDAKESRYSWEDATTTKRLAQAWSGAFVYRKLSPVDGAYSSFDRSGSISMEERGKTTIIRVGTGQYVFALEDPYRSYEILSADFSLRPLGTGVFYVDADPANPSVYSFSTLLDVGILAGRSTATRFTLFPTIFFEHDPRYARNLKDADILRISTIDSLRSLDAKTDSDLRVIAGVPAGDDPAASDRAGVATLLSLAIADVTERVGKYSEVFTEFLKIDTGGLPGAEFIRRYPTMLVNPAKKDAYDRKELLGALIELFGRDYLADAAGVKESEDKILGLLSAAKERNAATYDASREMIRAASYLWTATQTLHRDSDLLAHAKQKKEFSAFLQRVFPEAQVAADYHGTLSDVYGSYFFGSLIKKNVNKFLNVYLGDTLEHKQIERNDFLFFGFFLIRYLQAFDDAFSKDAFDIAYSLIRIVDEYYVTSRADLPVADRSALMSTIFYNYNVVLDHLLRTFRNQAFETRDDHLYLKEVYVTRGDSNIPRDVTKSLGTLVTLVGSKKGNMLGLEDVEPNMDDLLAFRSASLSGNRDTLFRTMTELQRILSIVEGYPAYVQDLQLTADRGRTGLDLTEPKTLDEQEARTFLAQFNGLDSSNLKIVNDFQKDGYFRINVPIKGNQFDFKLDPQGHTVYEITYVTPTGRKIDAYAKFSVSLDSKKETLDQLRSAAQKNPRLQYLSDFRNIFENMFFYQRETGDTTIQGIDFISAQEMAQKSDTGSTDEMSAETKVFIDRELIRKDFRIIRDDLPIALSDVSVKIENGRYDITILPIDTSIAGRNGQNIKFQAKYDFQTHSFYDIVFTAFSSGGAGVAQPRVDGYAFRVAAPKQLFIKDFKNFKETGGFYVEAAINAYVGNGQDPNIQIDLTNKTVTMRSVAYPVSTDTQQ